MQHLQQRLRSLLVWVKRMTFNRTSAVLVGTALIMVRQTIYSIILRGKWWNAVTTWFERRKQLSEWQSSKHSSVVQGALYSLSSNNRIDKRTLFEEDITSLLYHNKAAGQQMIRAAKLCSRDMPFVTQHLDLTHPLLNAILNKLSSLVASDHLKYESSGLYEPVWYVFGILGYSPSLGFNNGNRNTSSVTGSAKKMVVPQENMVDRRSSKLRVVVVREDMLQRVTTDHDSNDVDSIGSVDDVGGVGGVDDTDDNKSNLHPQKIGSMISERHRFRMDILKRMKKMYDTQQDCNITSVMDRIAGSVSRRHLLRVQIGYRLLRNNNTNSLYQQSNYQSNLAKPLPFYSPLPQSDTIDNHDSPMMFSPRR